MKRRLACFLLTCLLIAMVPVGAMATETEATEGEVIIRQPGQCGEDMTWSYDSGTLTISGNGNMDDYPDGDAPWLEWKENIQHIVFTGNITSVGEGAFTDYDELESVDFGPAMHTIGIKAFKSCDGLTSITLPASFRRFGKESFMSCRNLTQIICRGGMPSFNANCVWDTYATIYYPSNNPWPMEHVLQLTEAFQNRIQFQMGTPEEQTAPEITGPAAETQVTEPAVTEPAATVPAVTVPMETAPETTQAETIPAVEETQEAETTEETVWETVEPTVPETQPEGKKHLGSMNGVMVGLCIVTGVLSLMLLGALIFRRRSW